MKRISRPALASILALTAAALVAVAARPAPSGDLEALRAGKIHPRDLPAGGGCSFSLSILNRGDGTIDVAPGDPVILVVEPLVDCTEWDREEAVTVSATPYRVPDPGEPMPSDEEIRASSPGYFTSGLGAFRVPPGERSQGSDAIIFDLPPGEYNVIVSLHNPNAAIRGDDICDEAEVDLGRSVAGQSVRVRVE